MNKSITDSRPVQHEMEGSMAKSMGDIQQLSAEAGGWLKGQVIRAERHVIARAALMAAQSNDDIVLPSHLEVAWNEIVGRRQNKKRLGITIAVSALMGGVYAPHLRRCLGDLVWNQMLVRSSS